MGVMAVLQCATIVAVYLAAEARATGEDDFAASYRLKALFPGIITSVLGALCIALSITQAPWLWQGLLVLLALARRSYRLASLFVILQTAFMLTSWGVAQYPYIIPPAPTIEQAANAPQVIETLLIVMGIGMLIVVPAILYLFMVFKWSPAAVIAGSRPQEGPGTE